MMVAEDAEATNMMNALAVFARLNAEQRDYLDVLTEFVDEFDKSKKIHWPKISGLGCTPAMCWKNKV